MASSQVQMAASATFGCVLRDHNRREGCRESEARAAAQVAFQKNLKDLVRNHFTHTCISIAPSSSSAEETCRKQDIDNNQNNKGQIRSSRNRHHLSSSNNNNNKDKTKGTDNHQPSNTRGTLKQSKPEHSNHSSTKAATAATTSSSCSNEREDNKEGALIRGVISSSEASPDISKQLGASSLVRIWEKRLNHQPNSAKKRRQVPSEERNKGTETGEDIVASTDEQANEEEEYSSTDGESERAVTIPVPVPIPNISINNDLVPTQCSISRSSSICKSTSSSLDNGERVRISDIIKRLAAANQSQGPPSTYSDDTTDQEQSNSLTGSPARDKDRDRSFILDLAEKRGFTQVICSPRIRGRQAFTDLIMQMERDRLAELATLSARAPVSKFSHRGRIQALLRLRLLQRGMATQDHQPRQQSTLQPPPTRMSKGSNITHLRERFKLCLQNVSASKCNDHAFNPRSSQGDTVNQKVQAAAIINQCREEETQTQCPTVVMSNENHSLPHCIQNSVSSPTTIPRDAEQAQGAAYTSYGVTSRVLSFESQNVKSHSGNYVMPTATSCRNNRGCDAEKTEPMQLIVDQTGCDHIVIIAEESRQQCHATATEEITHCNYEINCTEQVEAIAQESQQQPEQCYGEGEGEEGTNYFDMNDDYEISSQPYLESSSYDWISPISRPRSYWEDLRQAWYKEMLNTDSDKKEIRQLLERRTVSTFLSSDFKQRMDKLMTSHLGRQTRLMECQEDEDDDQERMDHLMAFLQERMHREGSHEDGGEGGDSEENIEAEQRGQEEEEEEEEEEQSLSMSGQYREGSEDFDRSTSSPQMPSPSVYSSWSYRDSEILGQTTEPSSSPQLAQYQDRQQQLYSSSTNHNSMEMELIYDLRGQMEQLYHEMAELRKSLKSCTDMQMTMQQTMKQQAPSVQGEGNKGKKKGKCRVCYEVKPDTVLYRCGHMCTCLKCAHELQWNSGKCPICGAAIVDVVRVYLEA